jgi:hypothetical protein
MMMMMMVMGLCSVIPGEGFSGSQKRDIDPWQKQGDETQYIQEPDCCQY